MPTSENQSAPGAGLEPLGDPDEQVGDFAGEHEQFTVEETEDDNDREQESPGRYDGGLDREGPP